jgi:hypothetical protein
VLRLFLCVAMSYLVAGCTMGRDFVRPSAANVQLGATTRAEVIAAYGQPFQQSQRTSADTSVMPGIALTKFDPAVENGTFATLGYVFSDRTKQFWVGGAPTSKVMVFNFWNDKLFSYGFFSGFEHDSTNFDESKASALKPGETTVTEALQLLGEPSGRSIYPAIQSREEAKYNYSYTEISGGERRAKRLELLFGSNGRLVDYRLASDVGPAPAAPATGGAPVPIFIPRR